MNAHADICARRHRGSAESEAANGKVAPSKHWQRELIWQKLVFAGAAGATCQEISRETGISYTSCSARMSEMKHDRWIAPVLDAGGRKVRRKTQGGCSAGVWRALTHAERRGEFAPKQLSLIA